MAIKKSSQLENLMQEHLQANGNKKIQPVGEPHARTFASKWQ